VQILSRVDPQVEDSYSLPMQDGATQKYEPIQVMYELSSENEIPDWNRRLPSALSDWITARSSSCRVTLKLSSFSSRMPMAMRARFRSASASS